MSMTPRFENFCHEEDCCRYMGGTADFDIWMSDCKHSPYDPMVQLIAEDGGEHIFLNRLEMDETIDRWEREGYEVDKLRKAQTFVHTFFPTVLQVALDKMKKGEDL